MAGCRQLHHRNSAGDVMVSAPSTFSLARFDDLVEENIPVVGKILISIDAAVGIAILGCAIAAVAN